jgi:hypothetical protein
MPPWRGAQLKYRDYFTFTLLDGSDWSASPLGRFTLEATAASTHWTGDWWAPEPVWTRWRRENIPPRTGNRTPVFQSVAQ